MLQYFGQSPFIVRSSSFLEDGFGNAFAGKYESVFCVNQGTPEQRLGHYFDARWAFFREHPVYQRIFCEAVVTPPAHLSDGIRRRKQVFDALNTEILEQLLSSVPLRPDITKAEAAEVLRQFQDFVNAHHSGDLQGEGFEAREQECRRILNILLYGVTQRKE